MYAWYAESVLCYAYLADVKPLSVIPANELESDGWSESRRREFASGANRVDSGLTIHDPKQQWPGHIGTPALTSRGLLVTLFARETFRRRFRETTMSISLLGPFRKPLATTKDHPLP